MSILSFGIVSAQSIPEGIRACEYSGTVFQMDNDMGTFKILLDDGRWIFPIESSIPDFFTDNLRIRVSFEYLDFEILPCDGCAYVILTCVEPFGFPPPCKARFEAHPLATIATTDYAPAGYSYEFVDVSFGSVIERMWFIDGDSIFGEEVITHSFNEPGYHSVCLAIQTEEGCYDNFCMELYVGGVGECSADFGYFPMNDIIFDDSIEDYYFGEYPYQFYDQSQGEVIDWQWNFGDDVITGDSVPIYSFPKPGVYKVCLTIITIDSCISTKCMEVVVGDDPNCRAMFEYYGPLDVFPTEPLPDFPGSRVIQFVDMSRGDITHWNWAFGDGTYSTDQNPLHEFPHSGRFEVCLTVSSESGCKDQYCTVVYIDTIYDCKAYFENCIYIFTSPYLDFDMSGLIIGFKNQSYPNAVGSKWDFGDGSYSTEQNPIHVYQKPGVYKVCLTIYSRYRCSDTYCKDVYVGVPECKTDFTHEIIVPTCSDFETAHYFSAITSEFAPLYSWDFGDGNFGSGPEVAHVYSKERFYDVCLEVTYSNGCVAKKCKVINNSIHINDSIYFKKCNPNSTELPQSEQNLSVTNVYPVPASDVLNIDIYSENSSAVDISLINTLGQKTSLSENYSVSEGNNQLELQLDNMEPGTYIYVISSPDSIIRGRVSIIQ